MIETYLPLSRKYRPQQFGDLVGQDMVSTAIGNALTLHKIAHAYLFCGPRGTGKTSSARIFAKSLNCVNGPTPTPCQVCPSCIAITQGTALDVTEIDAASNNGVDNIRDITDKVQFSAIQGKFKVFIIDEVHMLSTAAFNALLKTLEEPPPNVVFIFATTEPHKVLPTIISRCQRFDFSRITRQQIEARLAQVAELEQIRIAPEAITLIARHARGGLRDALGLLDQVAVLGQSETGNAIQVADVRIFIGLLEADLVFDLAQGIITRQPVTVLTHIQHLQTRGVEPTLMVKELAQHFRNVLIAKTCGGSERAVSGDMFDIAPDLYEQLCQQATVLAVEEIPQMLTRLSQLEYQLKNSHQPQLWFEVAMLDLCYRHDMVLVQQLAERVHQLEQQLQQGTPTQRPSAAIPAVKAPASAPSGVSAISVQSLPPAAPGVQAPVVTLPVVEAITPEPATLPAATEIQTMEMPIPSLESKAISPDLFMLWQQMLQAIDSIPTRSLLQSSHFTLLAVDETQITVGYGNDALYSTFITIPKKVELLAQAASQVLDRLCQVHFSEVSVQSTPVSSLSQMTDLPALPLMQSAIVDPPVSNNPINAEPISAPASMFATTVPSRETAPPVVLDFELEQSKKYTQELMQGKLLD